MMTPDKSDVDICDRNLVCVLFPGIVQNEQRAVQCLGGIKSISTVNENTNKKRLGLSFQPENPYINKIFADTKKTAGVLIRVKIKKKKVNDKIEREVTSTAVVGRVNRIYKFDAMGDFQYLPVHNDGAEGSKPRCVLEDILPSGLDGLEFLNRNLEFPFVLPTYFTRYDRAIPYKYTFYRKTPGLRETEHDEVYTTKKRIVRASSPVRFNLTDDFPSAPSEQQLRNVKARTEATTALAKDLELVRKKFDERPIWSMNALTFHTKIKKQNLKLLIPAVAFYMFDGPWRALWVRFGYDPRKEPAARFYQTLDFRVGTAAGLDKVVSIRSHLVNYRKADRVWHIGRGDADEEIVHEGSVIFRPGVMMMQRQVFYQFCDIKLPEVEELLAEKPAAGYLCHRARGWLAPHAAAAARHHIVRYAQQMIHDQNVDHKFERTSSGDEQMSDAEEGASSAAHDHDASSN
ncbi:hypothetical protein JYU34_002308 [Plutella xylostella]|uniref:General transcription factor 3C polypeptide 5 n=1 Tax=Plutella xylostella TaxID=51655 RepID=A0ABQ7R1V1_PLUXY|nr:hypothetical protein JYU34_002308 [Plutella xylostella]